MVLVKMITILFICINFPNALPFGYDSGSDQAACGKPSRTAKEYNPPCDLTRENYCSTAGTAYPWHAVRRFVRDNQGLMKRMYGDQRHIAVLQAELENNFEETNEVHQEKYTKPNQFIRKEWYKGGEKDETSPRLLHEDPKLGEMLNAKFVYSEQASYKTKLYGPHFRPVTTPRPAELNFHRQNLTEVDTSTNVYENTTEALNINKEDFTENKTETETVTITDDLTTEYFTSTEKSSEEITTDDEVQLKKKVGEVLFQDMEEPSKKNAQFNFRLKGVNACPVKEEVVAPFWANNTRGEVLALLNLYPFEQYVHWEKCTYENRQMYCREGCRCEQQYRLHRLLAYDPHNECRGIFSDWFRFPSCCVCKCYNIPVDFRVTSRSPRNKYSENEIDDLPSWLFSKKEKFSGDG